MKMRRPPGLWILLSAGVLWLSLQDAYGIRATSLLFGKTSTTTSTTTEAPANEEETITTDPSTESNVTKPPLTGNPQLDYIYDPNLPKELNGYNLSEYPFYDRVPAPEEIDFKCDGLHDGFYASVAHKCQVYHHCLFGTRFDFLCANFTAFDQKTFICQFVSDVDCVNSKKFWHRNDALYEAQSTTTLKPVVIHTPPPDALVGTISPLAGARRPLGGGRRRPLRRRRPQFDYYQDDYYDDEYYEDRIRSDRRRKRPRPRPRPAYDEEYEDEDYAERRGSARRDEDRRRPHDRKPTGSGSDRRRTKPARKQEYDDDEVDERFEDEDFKSNSRRNKNDDKKKNASEDEEDVKPSRRKPEEPSEERKTEKHVPITSEERKAFHNTRKQNSQRGRPSKPDYEDDVVAEDTRGYDRPRKNKPTEAPVETRAIIKPVSGTIYDRPRVAPRIKLPVPKNEADKYAYKPIATQATPLSQDEEYYEDYEEEPLPKRQKHNRKPVSEEEPKQVTSASRSRTSSKNPDTDFERPGRHSPKKQQDDESYERRPPSESAKKSEETSDRPLRRKKPDVEFERPRAKYSGGRQSSGSRKRPVIEEYDDYEEDYQDRRPSRKRKPAISDETYEDSSRASNSKSASSEEVVPERRNKDRRPYKNDKRDKSSSTTTSTTTTTTTTTTTEAPTPREKPDPIVRVVKRPFLPSRGGNPYSARGLQPVGQKALDKKPSEHLEAKPAVEEENEAPIVFKPSPVIIKVPIRAKFAPSAQADEYLDPLPNKPKEYKGPRTTQKPKTPERNPLDLVENEYDVTLNDALNPTLPNLPVRGFPTGFSAAQDYTFSNYQRPRYVVDSVISPANTEYVYQSKPARGESGYSTIHNGQTNYQRSRSPNHQQTQAYYSNY